MLLFMSSNSIIRMVKSENGRLCKIVSRKEMSNNSHNTVIERDSMDQDSLSPSPFIYLI